MIKAISQVIKPNNNNNNNMIVNNSLYKAQSDLQNDKQIIEAYLILSDFFSRVSKVDSAFVYLKMHLAYKDSIERITNNELAEELTIKYETAEKEKLIQEQKYTITKNRYIIISIIFLIVVFCYNYLVRAK